ncbi:spore coat protein CotO [Anoxybacillus vitaminiphilus]|uniref:Spore coat protein CotO n=1 Tax=Paranoxybacillus vitaminiphilus TaxID=581036 RepID=A0A327Y4K1_9BACL|nr:CotO family spore coat protein [Anoxybacillus vitaminiphilus]RAK15357.1 spore coat protein CotO [Anoxybacillus vitaminiphilus]
MKTHQAVPNSPLLYIVQPKLKQTVTYMQETFIGHAEKDKKQTQEAQETFATKEFQKMTLGEKLNFLANLPAHLANIKCNLIMDNTNYEGYIIEYKDKQVVFQTAKDNERITLLPEKIVSLTLIGLEEEQTFVNKEDK